ncbi:MAG: 8-oxoguanine deaminase, partial [Oscillospiraceae bacterium]
IDQSRLSMVGTQFDPKSVLGTVGFKGNVDYTIVNGVAVVQNGELTTIDEDETVHKANEAVSRYLRR